MIQHNEKADRRMSLRKLISLQKIREITQKIEEDNQALMYYYEGYLLSDDTRKWDTIYICHLVEDISLKLELLRGVSLLELEEIEDLDLFAVDVEETAITNITRIILRELESTDEENSLNRLILSFYQMTTEFSEVYSERIDNTLRVG